MRIPNYVEVVRPAPGAVFIAPVDIRLVVRVQNVGPFDLGITANMTNSLAHVSTSPNPLGLVDDTVTYDWMHVAPGEYTVQAAMGGIYGGGGELLPGAVSAPVPFVVLDRRTASDEDGDGMLDRWEAQHGLNPSRPDDATGDVDTDGLTNYEKMLAGTDPSSSMSCLSINSVRAYEGTMELLFPSIGGRTYRLERSNSLTPATWTPLGDPIRGAASGWDGFRVRTEQLSSSDFFRVVLGVQ